MPTEYNSQFDNLVRPGTTGAYEPIVSSSQRQSSQNTPFDLYGALKTGVGTVQSMFAGNPLAQTAGLDPVIYAKLSPTEQLQSQEAFNLGAKNVAANEFDVTGAANLGISAFNAYNTNKYQNEMMDTYKADLGMKWKDQERRDAVRDKWSSAFQNS